MSKERAFVRYTKSGKLVPGSMIVTQGSYPNGPGTWKEITTDLCCEQNNNTMNYKVYTALLNQLGTDAPVATILENTLGGTPIWTKLSNGEYLCTLNGAFTSNKTFCSITYGPNNGVVPLLPHFGIYDYSGNSCLLTMYNSLGGTAIDPNNAYGNDICVEIRVYP